MAVRIRLRRMGKRNAAYHRIVVADSRSPRDGRFIENIGTYDPRHKTERIDLVRAEHWVANGAQPSETVAAIIKRARAGVSMGKDREKAPGQESAATAAAAAAPQDAPKKLDGGEEEAAPQEDKG